eukprot:6142086-Amphidinium_carterae.1
MGEEQSSPEAEDEAASSQMCSMWDDRAPHRQLSLAGSQRTLEAAEGSTQAERLAWEAETAKSRDCKIV